tara:strand:+ start:91 stop:501 length:411 start_codon:yes stop_codon:yes gene_type:complete
MDITKLYTLEAHNRGSEINIICVDDDNESGLKIGDYTEVFLTVSGEDSRAWAEAKLECHRKSRDATIANEMDEHKKNLFIAEALADAVIDWRGVDDKDGNPLNFDRALLAEFFFNTKPVADQVDRFIVNRSNFTKG